MSVEICVNLTGDLDRVVQVQLSTLDNGTVLPGLAIPDIDYQSLSTTLDFGEEGLMCRMVQLIPDLFLENVEIFMASIVSVDATASDRTTVSLLDSNREFKNNCLACDLN